MKKSNSKTKYYLKNSNNSSQKSKTARSLKKKNPIQLEKDIQEMTTSLEQSKINLRILKERLEQRKRTYNKLQGKPITNLTSEEKEKERQNRRKEISNRKYYDPIKRKKGKEREIIDASIKMEKEKKKEENEFERLGEEIDELVETNKELKREIQEQRKRKLELEKLKEKMIKENKEKKEILNELLDINNDLEKSVKNNDYKKVVQAGIQQEKEFSEKRDELEKEYQKVIQEYIKRERQELKDKEFKKKVEEAKRGKNNKKGKNKEIEEELKRMEDEKIMDRTPILDELLQKWRVVNKEKKDTLTTYTQNCDKIRDALEDIAISLDLLNLSELPEVYRKTEERLSNINFQIERLENEQDQLEMERDTINKQIDLLSTKKKGISAYRNKFIAQKKEQIEVLDNIIKKLKKNMRIKEELFKRIQPQTDNFLTRLNETYLSEYVPDKMSIDPNKRYNYKNINNYLSNVEDYFNLVNDWKGNNDTENFDSIEKQNFDKLREEMKNKLEGFEAKRLMNKSVSKSIQLERKKGKELNDIIKKTSNVITGQMKNQQNNKMNNSKFNRSSKTNSQDITEDGNYRYGNDSRAFQQSSFYYPSNSSLSNKNKKIKIK